LGAVSTATEVGGLDATVVIYDPSAGFVTGSGWINSPPGAYVPDPSLADKATFAFECKYTQGNSVPTGDTEFNFKLANLKLKSTSYSWLVVSGTKAQFKGSGTVTGSNAAYSFILTAVDGDLAAAPGPDRIRMKIWNTANGVILYDTQLGDDNPSLTTAIAGGQIIIHTPGPNGASPGLLQSEPMPAFEI